MASPILNLLAPVASLRNRDDGGHPKVTMVELFFDLVYVFTIIQLSHYLLEHQTGLGALESVTLFAAVWWAWNYTAWAANWIDPDHTAGRVFMFFLMACALLMAVAIHNAFSDRAGLFVFAYVTMALVRAGYMALVLRGLEMGQNYLQLGMWSVLSSIFWIAGAVFESMRLPFWIIAVLIDYGAPYARFWIPRIGKTPFESWTLQGPHLLERTQLFFIISLGESIILLGGTMVDKQLDGIIMLTATVGFLLIISLWWLYFDHSGDDGEEAFEEEAEQTGMARSGLIYAHGIIVCGAIVVAVAIEEIITNPAKTAHLPVISIAVTGPLIFVLGNALFRRTIVRPIPLTYLLPFIALPILGYLVHTTQASALVLGVGIMVTLLMTAFFQPKNLPVV